MFTFSNFFLDSHFTKFTFANKMFIEKFPFKTFYLFIRASIEVRLLTRLQFMECCPFNYKQGI